MDFGSQNGSEIHLKIIKEKYIPEAIQKPYPKK
jgi:hypothetical protein